MSEGSLYSLRSKNPEHADVELSVNKETNSVWITNPEPAVVEFSDKEKIYNLIIISSQIKNFENKTINKNEKEHSKIYMQIPFRTDIRGKINTDNDRAIYSNNILMICQSPISLIMKSTEC